jgi:hypothetical protein
VIDVAATLDHPAPTRPDHVAPATRAVQVTGALERQLPGDQPSGARTGRCQAA